jgi:hypothetical protein
MSRGKYGSTHWAQVHENSKRFEAEQEYNEGLKDVYYDLTPGECVIGGKVTVDCPEYTPSFFTLPYIPDSVLLWLPNFILLLIVSHRARTLTLHLLKFASINPVSSNPAKK